ncbi:hypothetical protein N7516_008005 [Penicillium verrucosum]|uniref:uncharacterized protein n=1 Tax=Penicillium verrucosum TaxID=60171 RepID=UPI002544F5D1|nr:uncharacterized protein N7516_008005 [Penicillium verrucosum]KAJ5926232.1 hypothetical protein N7516_008005 [Penicillium verrucosum]
MDPREARSTGYSTFSPTLEIKPKTVGRPRFDPYHKVLSRFYEPLVLLRLLGQSRGNHQPKPHDVNAGQAVRRDFLRNLSYICDFEKGGDTCTAIGLADLSACYRLYVASNKGQAKIAEFLKAVLGLLHDLNEVPGSQSPQKEAEFVKFCVDFAEKRIRKEKNCLFRAVDACSRKLSHSATIEECDPFGLVRHYIGRLAHHIRAPKELVKAVTDMSQILESCEVSAVDHIAPVPPPAPDRHTNLDGILNRMLGKGHDERLDIEHGLSKINAANGLFDRFPGEYRNLKPRIHAEVQILEHFHRYQIQFTENDRFVACSKAACLCCEMYFKHHPARMIVPESHRNVWTNWGPPLVENFSKAHRAGRQQLHILNKVIHEIGNLVISQALGQSSVGQKRPDSKTDITDLHSLGYTPAPINVSEKSSMVMSKDTPIEKQNQQLKNQARGPSISPGLLTHNNEESDDEGGGVSIQAWMH